MSAFEPGGDLMRDTNSSPNLKTSSMDCCLEVLHEHGPESPMDQHKVDEQYSESFLPDLHQLLPEVLQEQDRSQVVLDEHSSGWHVRRLIHRQTS